jgi:hypothetical protein
MKDYLGFENARNKEHAALYERLLRIALKDEKSISVLIGHHICFECDGKLDTENEIPSADCLMFDHDLMTKVFGDSAVNVMLALALVPMEVRDDTLKSILNNYHPTA